MNHQQFATYGHPSSAMQQQQQQMYAAAARTNSGYGGQFATAGRTASMSAGSGAGALPPISTWTPPSPQEHQYYDVLFAVADEEKRNAIGGRLAVMFFSRSNADKQILREIWNIADAQQRGELSRNEFYVAMRLISMAQRGDVVSVQRFFELAVVPFPLPVLDGVPPPSSPAPAVSASGASARSPYAVTDEEKTRYDAIFAQYDADHDGFLLGGEAVALFQMSGLDRNALREIWALADRGQDSMLDVREFYVAMHLIVCASKRGLPVPSQLPQELSDSAFGPSARGSFTAPSGDVAASQSRNGSLHESSSADASDDPFAGLSPAKDAASVAAPRLGSFSAIDAHSDSSAAGLVPQPPPSAMPEHRGSFQQPTPPGSARGSFYGAPMPMPTPTAMPPTQDAHSVGLDQLHMAPSSTGSFSGVHSAPQSHMEAMPANGMMSHHHVGAPGLHGHGGMMGSGYGAVPPSPPMMPAMSVTKPFLSDDDEVHAVKQLDETNEQVVKCLTDIATKQSAIETLAEKLRELDQLRHDLVALAMKRENVRAANSAASAPSAASSSASDQQLQLQSKRAVESSLQDLIDSEKRTVARLQHDVVELETELQQSDSASLSTSFGSMSMSSSTTPAPAPAATDFSFAPVAKPSSSPSPASFDSFGGFGGASSSASSTPAAAAPASFDFAAPSPANSTSSAGFDSFGDFSASKPAPSPATTAPSPSGFDAFASFGFS